MSDERLAEVEGLLNYTFTDKSLLQRALTLSSHSVENNERLEFFGDAILQFIVSEELYAQGGNEGSLTERRKAVVSKEGLEGVSNALHLPDYLVKGLGDNNNHKAISSVYEAVTAAIYLDGGIAPAKDFVLRTADFGGKYAVVNYKGILKERMEKLGGFDSKKAYTDGVETPNGGTRRWQMYLTINGKQYVGYGSSKDKAEQECARQALAEM